MGQILRKECLRRPMLDIPLLQSIAAQLMSGRKGEIEGAGALPVRRTGSQRFRMVTFEMNGRKYQAIEQNASKPSRWGELARQGHQVVQFRDIDSNKYVAVSVDGEIHEYAHMGK